MELCVRFFMPSVINKVDISRKSEDIVKYGFISKQAANFKFIPKENKLQKRILFLGDSFVYGGSFNTLFADKLKKQESLYLVDYLSTGGWGTDQEYIAFREKVLEYKPDVVFLCFCLWNDIANNLSSFHQGEQIKPYFLLDKDKLVYCNSLGNVNSLLAKNKMSFLEKIFSNIDRFLALNSDLYFYLTQFLRKYYSPLFPNKRLNIDGSECSLEEFIPENYKKNKILSSNLTDRISHFLPMVTEPKPSVIKNGKKIYIADYGYKLTLEILKEFDKEIKEYGGEFYVLLLPFANPYGWKKGDSKRSYQQADGTKITLDFMYQINRLKDLMSSAGIKVIDFSDQMEKQYSNHNLIIKSSFDPHYNSRGNKFLSECLYEYFRKFIQPVVDKKH